MKVCTQLKLQTVNKVIGIRQTNVTGETIRLTQ